MSGFGKFSRFEPPADQRERELWLLACEERIARRVVNALTTIVEDAVDAYLSTLVAAGDMGVFDGIPARWGLFVDEVLLDELTGMYLSGGLSAWIAADSDGDIPERIVTEFTQVINQNAVSYAQVAQNRMADVGLTTWNMIKDQVSKAILTGESVEKTRDEIMRNVGFSKKRAEMIARTETINAFNNGDWDGDQALGEFGPVYKYWMATLDARGRETHIAANRQVKLMSEPFIVGGEEMMFPHAPGASAKNVVNCIVEGEKVLPIGDLESISRAWWDGPTVQLVTADGESIRVTPNHPILTDSGMKPAQTIQVGDNLIGFRLPADKPNYEDAAPRVEELYRASCVTAAPIMAIARSVDFHGDIVNGDVEVVWPDSSLCLNVEMRERTNRLKLMVLSHAASDLFAFGDGSESSEFARDEMVSWISERLISGDDSLRMFPKGIVRLSSDLASLIKRAVLKPNEVSFRAGADWQTHFGESQYDDIATDSVVASNLFDAMTGLISGSEIIKVDVDSQTWFPVGVSGGEFEGDASVLDSAARASVSAGELRNVESAVVSLTEVVEINWDRSGHWVFNLTSSSGLLWSPAAVHSNCRCVYNKLWPGDPHPVTGEPMPEPQDWVSDQLPAMPGEPVDG